MRWTIDEAHSGARLDVFLTEQRPEETRSQIQKRIKAGAVLVNGNTATVHRFLKKGDVVEWGEVGAQLIAPKTKGAVNRAPTPTVEPHIIAETDDWIVVDKPAGLLVHPDTKTKEGTLVDWLIARSPEAVKTGEHPERPGIVHRLDREVSGLMVLAKNHATFESLQKQFSGRTVEKHDLALVHGMPPKEEGDIKFRIARSSTQARMAARPVEQTAGRAAWSHYKTVEALNGAALLDVQILSGRQHQIRAHLQALGNPVMGDALYAIKTTKRNVKAPRLMLQGITLAFDDPRTGERRSFTLAPDPAFDALAKTLR